METRKLRRIFVAMSLAVLLVPVVGWAQSQAINGSIRGRITDPSDAAITDASVTIKNNDTGYTKTVTTSADGYYVAPDLPLGTYTVTVEKQGFDKISHPGIVLQAGNEAVIDAQLKIGEVTNTVEVTAGAPIIEPTRANIGRTIDQREVVNLPLTSRNPYNFILFQPGVSGHPNPELGIPRTLNTNGSLDRINYQMDGMGDTEGDRYGLRLFPISDVYVREVQTVSNSFAPEFGGTAGDIFNVITNSGTNDIHGEFQWLKRSAGASAWPFLTRPTATAPNKPAFQLNDYAANDGGHIVRDKLFYFAGYEHLSRGTPAPNLITSTNATELENFGAFPASQLIPANVIQYAQFLDTRIDWNATPRNQVFIRLDYFRNRYPFNGGTGGFNALSQAVDFKDRAYVAGGQWVSSISSTLLNELRFSYALRDETHFPSPGVADPSSAPSIHIANVAFFGGHSNTNDHFREADPNWNDNFTWIHGAHSFKFGAGTTTFVDYQRDGSNSTYTFPVCPTGTGGDPDCSNGTLSNIAPYQAAACAVTGGGTPANGTQPGCAVFTPTVMSGLAAASAGICPGGNALLCYSNFASNSDLLGLHYNSTFFTSFAQDSWQVKPSLMLIFGVRYERYQGPPAQANAPFVLSQTFNTPGKDFSPRLGLAWRISDKTVLRASFGTFFDPPPTNTWFLPLNLNGLNREQSTSLGPTATGAPLFPNVTLVAGQQNVTTLTPAFKNAYAQTASLQISRQLSNNDAITVAYVNTGGRDLMYLHNINLINPIATLTDGRPVYGSAPATPAGCPGTNPGPSATRLNPCFNNVTLQDVGANSSYNALIVSYQHRFLRGLQASASYTYSHTICDGPDVNSFEQNASIEDNTNLKRDRSNCIINRPQALTFSAVLEPQVKAENKVLHTLLNDNMFALLGNISSGDQQNVASSPANFTGDTTAAQRPLGVGRYSVRGPKIAQIDLRYTRTLFTWKERLRTQFLFEANNLFNTVNITSLNTTLNVVGSPTSGSYTNVGSVSSTPTTYLTPSSSVLEGRLIQFGLSIHW